MKILNLTQHEATQDQIQDGVVEPHHTMKIRIQELLTFDTIPSKGELEERANELAMLANAVGAKKVMIGGAPFFMSILEYRLQRLGIAPLYAFSVRNSIEQPDGNGGVKKVNVFKHVGFVEV